jgi:protein TonB
VPDAEPRPVGIDVEAPVLLRRVEPEYPEVARHARIEGDVILEAIIGTDGRVESVKVLRSSPLLEKSAIKAVSQWIYRPARQNGRAVKVYFTVFISFRLS